MRRWTPRLYHSEIECQRPGLQEEAQEALGLAFPERPGVQQGEVAEGLEELGLALEVEALEEGLGEP